MLNRRFHLHGLFAVLLALMAQLGAGSSVPRIDPIVGIGLLCHAENNSEGTPAKVPSHSVDCLICPLCVALNAHSPTLVSSVPVPVSQVAGVVRKAGLPPPATGPPAPHRPPSQPRAPPTFS